MRRLAALYGLMEHSRAMELGIAAAAVTEVERASEALGRLRRRQTDAGLDALKDGDATGWAMAQAAKEAVKIRGYRLDAVWVERQEEKDKAVVSYRMSRVEMKQMENAVERVRVQGETQAARRLQRDMDDRYLSRREWMAKEERRRWPR